MNLLSVNKLRAAGAPRSGRAQGFTMPEMMIAVLIFSMMMLAVVGVWMFCLRWDELVCSRVGASDKSRMSFDQVTTDIRSAKWWKVGSAVNNGTTVTFTQCTNKMDQFGNARLLSSSGDTNSRVYP